MTREFTARQITETLTQIIADNGKDYVYLPPGGSHNGHCVYAELPDREAIETRQQGARDDIVPSCIIGHLLHRLAPDVLARIAADFDNTNAGIIMNEDAVQNLMDGRLGHEAFEYANPRVVESLRELQTAQDTRMPWGQAMDHYDRLISADLFGYADAVDPDEVVLVLDDAPVKREA
ncbi:MAG: hypothetical protein ACTH32_06535 [Microbacterium gubbeenense]|uniref:hypothetical protein n=1 Tax=Microbacterium gubbeenense TaxID=159896 RepID=UPI003F99DBC5